MDCDPSGFGIDLDLCLVRYAFLRRSGYVVVRARCRHPPRRELGNRIDHALFAVIEPALPEGIELVPPDLGGEVEYFALPDPRRAQHGKEVTPPLLWNADPHFAHAQDRKSTRLNSSH